MIGTQNKIWHTLAVVTLAACAAPGCTSMQPQGWNPFGNNAAKTAAKEAGPAQTFFVDFQRSNGETKSAAVAWSNDLHVQDALRQTGGFRKFGRFDVELHRQLPQGGLHRMTIDYARSTQRVEPEFDYVVHPGDRLVIIEREETFLDDAANAVLEPLGLEHVLKGKRKSQQMPTKYRMQG